MYVCVDYTSCKFEIAYFTFFVELLQQKLSYHLVEFIALLFIFLLLFYFSHPPNVTSLQAIKKAINILSNIQTLKLTIYYPLLHIIHQMLYFIHLQFHP